jgi:hypothetical protein
MDRASKIVPISRFSRTKMYLKDKFYTLKMKESDNITKHIHLFRANLHQLTTIGAAMLDDKAIICIMRSMPPSYKTFISFLMRQPNLTFQSLITTLFQERNIDERLHVHDLYNESSSTLYVKKKYSKYNINKFTKYNKTFTR